jgi:hypothetical protein
MTDIADKTANLEADQIQEIAKPLTLDEARAARKSNAEQSNTTKVDETKTEEDALEVETPDVEAEVEDEETVDEDEISSRADEIDVDSLSEDDIYALAKLKGIDIENPKSSKAWAEQRKEIKTLKEQIEAVQREKEEALAIAPVSDSPFANLRDADSVERAIAQAELNAEYWNDQLVLNQETQWDDVTDKDIRGVLHEGKFYPAEQVLGFVKAERAKIKPLGERKAEIAKTSELFSNESEKIESIKTSLGLEGELGESYDKLIKSPKFVLVKSLIPEYGLELMELLGHAARSQAEGTKKPIIKRKAPKSKDESVSIGGGARSSSKTASGREAALNKIVNGTGYNMKAKMDAMRELRILRTTK